MAANPDPSVIPANIKFLTRAEVERLRELVAQREGAVSVANTAVSAARQMISAVEAEADGLKAHYGVDKSAQVGFDLAKRTMSITPATEELHEV